jgi:hypothetical protein
VPWRVARWRASSGERRAGGRYRPVATKALAGGAGGCAAALTAAACAERVWNALAGSRACR